MMPILLLTGIGAVMLAAPISPGRAGTSDRVIGTVGQQAITETRYLNMVRTAEANLSYMQGEIENDSPNRERLERFVQLIEHYGVYNAALGALIQELALYEFALNQGISVSPGKVAAQVERDRRLVDTIQPPPEIAARIGAVGAERFWTEVYPPLVELEMTINKLWQNVRAGISGQAGQEAAWTAVQQQAVDEAVVKWPEATDSGLILADLESALAYLNDYWALICSWSPQLEESPCQLVASRTLVAS